MCVWRQAEKEKRKEQTKDSGAKILMKGERGPGRLFCFELRWDSSTYESRSLYKIFFPRILYPLAATPLYTACHNKRNISYTSVVYPRSIQ